MKPLGIAKTLVVANATQETAVLRTPSPSRQLKGVLVAHTAVSQGPVYVIIGLRVATEGGSMLAPLGTAWVRASSISAADGGRYFPVDTTLESGTIEVTVRNDTGAEVTVGAVPVVE